jgi:hypothetical protein
MRRHAEESRPAQTQGRSMPPTIIAIPFDRFWRLSGPSLRRLLPLGEALRIRLKTAPPRFGVRLIAIGSPGRSGALLDALIGGVPISQFGRVHSPKQNFDSLLPLKMDGAK